MLLVLIIYRVGQKSKLLILSEYVNKTEKIGGTHTHTRLTVLCPERRNKIWILLKQETVSGSGISWARMPFLPPNQQRQSTEGSTEKIGGM